MRVARIARASRRSVELRWLGTGSLVFLLKKHSSAVRFSTHAKQFAYSTRIKTIASLFFMRVARIELASQLWPYRFCFIYAEYENRPRLKTRRH
ncbi:MAG: hypothetical protein A2928_02065 [Candidatus Taylorbacteria bacterium RIFCSPLOWO2_01_FULL_45_15b]|uniref:Uncharacterized protein n=1 Tax=Candidatus Taylorbacteria bacterium RIFCSPLOWO2_01_FULL_45_15b TaxID=1802319 RepID=A0A1G2N6U6_9BACT|nr:MAG: hypothetical protein A2928_02065 [Candidatus Taylorbacteria bacterium RIFCSPLOWO2_01_FULL_45_15b]